jgi:ApbE superfamily uncharacterized protein (UPF0280 family)
MPDNTEDQVEMPGAEDQNTETTVEEFDPERAMHTIKTLRAETKAAQKALKEATTLIQQHEDAKLSEQEKLTRELETLRAERDAIARDAHAAKASTAITSAAATAGALRPDAIAKLVDVATFDGDNAGDLVKQVREQFPELFASRPGNADAGAGKTAPQTTDFNSLLRQAAGRS